MSSPVRAGLAVAVARAVGGLSRRLSLGGGSVIGGRAALAVAPDLLAHLAAGRQVALVSGTNGKTTTTRLLAAALAGREEVATSAAGANLPAGVVAALVAAPAVAPAVLEVDEAHLPAVARAVDPEVVVLLNLSRDQLDRVNEVRMLAGRWRELAGSLRATVVANADDPLVVWAASPAGRVRWVGAGQRWHADAAGCPACGGRIRFPPDGAPGGWACTSCGFRRPEPETALDGAQLVDRAGGRHPIAVGLPGRCNEANAAMAAVAAEQLGTAVPHALAAMGQVRDVAGRFARVEVEGTEVRLLLAKNPAGWVELLDLLEGGVTPVVVGINAEIADGRDPSWLWDVEFERLRGRPVVATGERCADLAVRLRYAGVAHRCVADQVLALGWAEGDDVEYVGNYTAFQALRRRLGPPGARPGRAARPASAAQARPAAPPAWSAPVSVPPDAPMSPRRGRGGPSTLRVVVVLPDLLGTYGDGGNGRILACRAAWRGVDVEVVAAESIDPLPAQGDIYCLGGGEDAPQVLAAELLGSGALAKAVAGGAVVLGVCAGYQLLGDTFPDAAGATCGGLGLLDVHSVKGVGRRAVGELLAEVAPVPRDGPWSGVGVLSGFENHSGVTRLGAGAEPLATVLAGVGNGAGGGTEGAVAGRVVGCYLHGPVLARNPAFADALLRLAGVDATPLDDREERALRSERLTAARRGVSAGGGPPWRRRGPRPQPGPRARG